MASSTNAVWLWRRYLRLMPGRNRNDLKGLRIGGDLSAHQDEVAQRVSALAALARLVACLGHYGLVALAIAWATVGGHAIAVARANPIDALRVD